MATRTVSYGKCFLCGETFAKNAINRHLQKCVPAHETGRGEPVRLFRLQVEGYYSPQYWMHLEIPATATLADLDDFLRDVWLECCGHLSAFTIGNTRYKLDAEMVDAMWGELFPSRYTTRDMDVSLEEALSVGQTFTYEYDFGTTTTLRLKVVGEREGPWPKGGVLVLARNYAPVFTCTECGEPARWVYTWSGEYETYCDKHAREHEDWENGFLPIVNSPRVGECAYTGPTRRSLKFEETMPEKAGESAGSSGA
ncbi:MAG: hypothetical protein H5T61_05620 [Thermoflexales bacterium]|nr:hypothetical protein [Thermoflexales bacterium]